MDWAASNAYKNFKESEPKSIMEMAMVPHVDPSEMFMKKKTISGDLAVETGLVSSEKGNAASASASGSTKPRKKTMTSVYLRFFETAQDGKSRRCKFCGQSYSIATATGNLGRHLGNRHPGYDKSSGDVVISPLPPQPITVIRKHQPQPQPQLQTKASLVDYDHLNWLIVKWLTLASLSPSTVEETWLVNSYKFLNPSIQLWPSEDYKKILREVFRSMQEAVRVCMDNVTSKVSITLDFWTSYERIFYMSVTCHWIDENWCFQKMMLDVCHIPFPCGVVEIYNSLVKVLRWYNIENRVLSCTHDNSQSALQDLDGQNLGHFCYIPCSAHTLNLIIDDGLRTIERVIAKIREFVISLNASSEISEEFTQLSAALHEGIWKTPLDASTRWSGNYQMLDIVCKASKSMDAVIRKYDTLGNRMLLSAVEKNAVSNVHRYLEPFYKTTNNMCTNKVPTVGLVLFFMDHISETIATCRDSHLYPELKNAAEDMAKKVRSYNSQVCNIFTYMTAILDPRIKGELIPESLNSDNFLEEARTHFIRNYSINHFPSMIGVGGYSNQEIEEGGNVSFAEEIARKKRRTNTNNSSDELTQYLSETTSPIPTDVLEWWKINSMRYPRLSVMARDFLAVQANSVAPEELFCGKGAEIDKQRFCMPHDSTQALLCIKSWLQSGMKLKYKTTEIDFERLMELATSAINHNSSVGSEKKQRQ